MEIWSKIFLKGLNDQRIEIRDETRKGISVKNAVGQAYAYRAMCYLDLARLYEPKQNTLAPVSDDVLGLTVPIVDEYTDEEIAKNNPRATREDLYEFIFSDLETAQEYLAGAGNSYNQPTLGAVYGMYARAYLELGAADDKVNKSAYAKAAEYARKAITVSGKTPHQNDTRLPVQHRWRNPQKRR